MTKFEIQDYIQKQLPGAVVWVDAVNGELRVVVKHGAIKAGHSWLWHLWVNYCEDRQKVYLNQFLGNYFV